MPKLSDEKIAIWFVAFIAVWALVVLPIMYSQSSTAPPETTEFWTIAGHRLKITDTLIAAFTLLLFIATLFLFSATKALVETAEKTAERQLRAYVFAQASTFDRGPGFWQCKISMTNAGQTPAYELIQKSSCAVFDASGTDADWAISVPFQSRFSMPPGGVVETTVNTPVTVADSHAVAAGQKVFYVFGEISYRDAFDKPRLTKFRLHSNKDAGRPNILLVSGEGNEET